MNTSCSIELLRSVLDGNLPPESETALVRHLETCQACSEQLEQMAGGAELCRETARLLADDDLDAAVPIGEGWSEIDFVVEHLDPAEEPDVLGRLGGYDVLEVIGRGGMGVVLKGYDRSLKRCVAIKVLAPHLAQSSLARQRFAREAQAAAAVVHPNVLAIHQVQPQGRLPFLVMPLVAGQSLAERLAAQGTLELKEILRIAMQAAAGLAAAHEQGLVHRDVKPANILLETGVERAVLTDFGLARAADDMTLTRQGIIAGTPEYMSPEQARGEPLDGRSDLFSLGSVMFEMASGVSPFRADSTVATLRRLVDESPRALSSINPELPPWFISIVDRLLAKDAARRFASAKELSQLLENCLAHVQQPANVPLPPGLPKSSRRWTGRPSHRFIKGIVAMITAVLAGVLGFALLGADIPDISGRWTGDDWGDVVMTRSSSGHYTGTYSETLGKAPGEIEVQWSKVERRFNGTWREGTDRLGQISLRLAGQEIRGAFTTDMKSKLNPGTPALADLQWTRADRPKGELAVAGPQPPRERTPPPASAPPLSAPPLSMPPPQPRAELYTDARVKMVAWSPDGKMLAIGGTESMVQIRDPEAGAVPAREPVLLDDEERAIVESSGVSPAELIGRTSVTALAFSPDYGLIAVGTNIGQLKLFDAHTGELVRALDDPRAKPADQRLRLAYAYVKGIAFSPNGASLATCGLGDQDGNVKIWDAETGELKHELASKSAGDIVAIAFSPDRELLAGARVGGAGTPAAAVDLFNLQTHEVERSLSLNTGDAVPLSLGFSPDGSQLVVGYVQSGTGSITGFYTATGIKFFSLSGLLPSQVAFSPDGKCIAAFANPRHFVLEDYSTGLFTRSVEPPAESKGEGWNCFALSPDGSHVAIGGLVSGKQGVRIWNLAPPPAAEGELAHSDEEPPARSPSWSPPAVKQQDDGAAGAISAKAAFEMFVDDRVKMVAYSPDGKTIAIGAGKAARLFDAATGKPKVTLPLSSMDAGDLGSPPHLRLTAMAFSPDSRLVAVADGSGHIKLLEADGGKLALELGVPGGADIGGPPYTTVNGLAFSPDGKLLASSGEAAPGNTALDAPDEPWPPGDEKPHTAIYPLRVWDLTTGKLKADCERTGPVNAIEFSPDGQTLAGVGLWESHREGILREPFGKNMASGVEFWDPYTGERVKTRVLGDTANMVSLSFSPDGGRLATGAVEGAGAWIKMFYPATGIFTMMLDETLPDPLAFSPNGRLVGRFDNPQHFVLNDALTGQFRGGITASRHSKGEGWNCFAFSPDGDRVAIGGLIDGRQGVRVWKLGGAGAASGVAQSESEPPGGPGEPLHPTNYTGKPVQVGRFRLPPYAPGAVPGQPAPGNQGVLYVDLPDEEHIWINFLRGSDDKIEVLLNAERADEAALKELPGRLAKLGQAATIMTSAVSPDERIVAEMSRVYELLEPEPAPPTGAPQVAATPALRIENETAPKLIAYSPDGKTLATAGDGLSVEMFDAESGQPLAKAESTSKEELAVFTSDNSPLPTGRIYEVDVARHKVTALAFSPDSKFVAVGNSIGQVKMFDARDRSFQLAIGDPSAMRKSSVPEALRGRMRLAHHQIESIAFSFDGRLLATSGLLLGGAGTDQRVRLWDTKTGEERSVIQGEHNFVCGPVAFSPIGNQLAGAAGWFAGAEQIEGIKFRKPTTSEVFKAVRLGSHGDKTVSLSFSPDGNFLARASTTYDKDRDRTLGAIQRIDVTLTPDYAHDNHFAPVPPTLTVPRPTPVAYSPNGKYLAGFNGENKLTFWAADSSWREAGTIEPADATSNDNWNCFALAPTGRIAIGGTIDGKPGVRIWDLVEAPTRADPAKSGGGAGVPDELAKALAPHCSLAINLGAGELIGIQVRHDAQGKVAVYLEGRRTDDSGLKKLAKELAARSQTPSIQLQDVNGIPPEDLQEEMHRVYELLRSAGAVTDAEEPGDEARQKTWKQADASAASASVAPPAEPLLRIDTESAVKRVVASPDGKTLALVTGGEHFDQIGFYDSQTGEKKATVGLVDKDEEAIFAESYTNWPTWNVEVSGIEFSPDSTLLAIGTRMGQLKLFDAGSGELKRSFDDPRMHDLPHPAGEPASPVEKLRRIYGWVNSLSFSPDGHLLATCGNATANKLKLWNLESGELVRELPGAYRVAFSPDGKQLAAVSDLGTNGGKAEWGINIWAPDTGKLHRLLLLPRADFGSISPAFTALTWSADGKRLASGAGALPEFVDVFDPATAAVAWSVSGTGRGPAIFSPDGKYLACLGEAKVEAGHPVSVSTVMLIGPKTGLSTGAALSTISLLEASTGKPAGAIHSQLPAATRWDCFAFIPGTGRIAIGGLNGVFGVTIWAVPGEKLTPVPDVKDPAAGSPADPNGGQPRAKFTPLLNVNGPAADSPAEVLGSGKQSVLRIPLGHADFFALSPDGKTLAVGDIGVTQVPRTSPLAVDGVRFYDAQTGKATGKVELVDEKEGSVLANANLPDNLIVRVVALAFMPDGKRLAAGTHVGQVKIIDVARGKLELTLDDAGNATKQSQPLHSGLGLALGGIEGIVFSPDGKLLITSGQAIEDVMQANFPGGPGGGRTTGQLKVWDARTGKLLHDLAAKQKGRSYAIAVSPDGKTLASAADHRISDDNVQSDVTLWDLETFGFPPTLSIGDGTGRDAINQLAFSPDGKHLAVGRAHSDNGESVPTGAIDLFDISAGKLERSWPVLFPRPAVFTPDGKNIATLSVAGSITLWNPATGARAGELESPQKLSPGQWSSFVFAGGNRVAILNQTTDSKSELAIWDLPAGK